MDKANEKVGKARPENNIMPTPSESSRLEALRYLQNILYSDLDALYHEFSSKDVIAINNIHMA